MRNNRLLRHVAGVSAGALALGGLLVASQPSRASAESIISQIGTDFVGGSSDTLAYSIALSSDGYRVAIGIPQDDPGGATNAGSVKVYDWNGTAWVQAGADIPGEAAGDNSGRSVSLSADGTRLAVGAYLNQGVNGTTSGHVRVWEWDGSAWAQLGSDIDGEASGDMSGAASSISADGTTVAIGAPANSSLKGHVRVFRWSGTAWVQRGTDIDGEAFSDYSGGAVSLSSDGSRVAIGAYGNNGNGTDSGHVRVHSWDGSAWAQLGQDIDGEADYDASGYSVAISGDGGRIIVGAYGNDGAGASSGHARVYGLSGSTWVQLGQDIDGLASGDREGESVSISADGTRVVIGAGSASPDGQSRAGTARILDWNGSSWVSQGAVDGTSASDFFGVPVSISANGNRVAVGAPLSDVNGGDSGYARVFQISSVDGRSTTQLNQSEEPGQPGVFLTISGQPRDAVRNVDLVFGSYAIQPRSAVLVTVQQVGATAHQVISSSRANGGGHLEQVVSLPALSAGRYTITLSAQSANGQLLVLGNRIEVNSEGQLMSLTPEALQPTIR